MFKKLLLGIVAVALILGFIGCKNNANVSDSEDLTKVSMLFMEGGNSPYKPDWLVLKEIERRFKTKLELQVVPGKDYSQKRSIIFASGELPDLIVNCWPSEMGQYAEDGIVLPISDHLDKLPGLVKIINDWNLQSTIDNISEMDGKFYILPDMRKELPNTHCFAIREDIFNKNNIPVPETYDELLETLKQIKAIYPDTLGLGELYNGGFMMSYIAEAFNTHSGFSLPFGYAYHHETGEWYYAPTSREYFDFITYMNNLYTSGGLDPEAFTQDTSQYEQKILSEKYMIIPLLGPWDAKVNTSKIQKAGVTDAKFTALYPLAGPTGLRKVKPGSRNQGGMAVSAGVAKRKDFDKVMKFLNDYYYSEEGAILSRAGAEGVTFDRINGEYKMKPDIKTPMNVEGTRELQKEFAIDTIGLLSHARDLIPAEIKKMIVDPDQDAYERYLIDNDMKVEDDPIVKMTTEQRERVKLLVATLNDYTAQMRMKFIYGQASLSTWDEYVRQCEAKGSKELLEIVNKAWKENNHK